MLMLREVVENFRIDTPTLILFESILLMNMEIRQNALSARVSITISKNAPISRESSNKVPQIPAADILVERPVVVISVVVTATMAVVTTHDNRIILIASDMRKAKAKQPTFVIYLTSLMMKVI